MSELQAKLMPGVAKRITDMIAALKNWQEFLNANGYEDSAPLLEMAALDLQMKLHSISDAELAQFCEAISNKLTDTSDVAPTIENLGPHFKKSKKLPPERNIIIMNEARTATRTKMKH